MQSESMPYRALFHIHEEEKAVAAISNMKNILDDLGEDDVQVELLLNGPAVKISKEDSQHKNRLRYLAKRGAVIKVCLNSLNGFDIKEKELIEEAEIVPAGVSELVVKQDEGWAYVKP